MKKLSKKYIILFSVLLIAFFPSFVKACSYGTEFEDIRYIILNPNLSNNKSWWTYFYTSKYHYMDAYVHGNQDELEIVKEWKQKFKLQSNESDIENYLFGGLTVDSLKKNPFYKEIQSNTALSAYFLYAKECESVIFRRDYWETIDYDSIANVRRGLIKKGLKMKQTDPFWQKKYAFQLLRLAYYHNDYKLFNQLYNTHFGFGREKTALDWWATHYKSMVLEKSDKDSANYIHAIVFSHSSNKMFASRQMFSSRNFSKLKLLARDNHDMADLYILKALVNSGKVLDDIKEIVRIDKNHPLLSLLLIREMNKLEDWIGTHKYSRAGWGNSAKSLTNDYYYLRAFYKQIQSMQPPTGNEDLFYLISANLALMNQDGIGAKKYLSLIQSKDSQITFQKNVLQIMLLTVTQDIREPNTANEVGELLQYLLANKHEQFESQKIAFSVMKFLEYNLREKGSEHLAGLMDYIAEENFCNSCKLNSLEYGIVDYFHQSGKPEDVEKVVALFSKKNKTKLEEFLLIPYPDNNYFKELLGTLYMRQGNTKKAVEIYAQIPVSFWEGFDNMTNLDDDPFHIYQLTGGRRWKPFYNKFEVANKLMALEESSKNNPKDLITLGHAWLNFSGAGNSWFMLDYAQSVYFEDISKGITESALKRSLGYYQQAYSMLTSPEERAEVSFGIASIHNLYGKATEENYGRWADEYEKYNETEFYRRTNCLTTYDIQDKVSRKAFFDRDYYW